MKWGLYRPYIDAGFDYLYDKVNLYDTLRAVETGHVSAAAITSCWQTVGDIMPHMLNFLENHDEQRFASAQYAGDPQRVWPSLAVRQLDDGHRPDDDICRAGEPANRQPMRKDTAVLTAALQYSTTGAWTRCAGG